MKKIAIIGVGQIGSRHLQGLASSIDPLDIYAIDPGEASRTTAAKRWAEVAQSNITHQTHFASNISELPDKLDLVIVASTSKVRLNVIEEFFESHTTSALILEKFLFANLDDYKIASEILEKKGIPTWVNCPMRLFPAMQWIKRDLTSSEKLKMNVTGSGWGLGTNAIHFLDLFAYFCESERFSTQTFELSTEIRDSKRTGYVEVDGKCSYDSGNGDELFMESLPEGDLPIKIEIKQGSNYWQIVKLADRLDWFFANDQSVEHGPLQLPAPFQSQLTSDMVDEICATGKSGLTPWRDSFALHTTILSDFIANFPKSESRIQEYLIT